MAQRLATRAEIVGEVGIPGGVAPGFNTVTDAQLAVWADIAALVVSLPRWRLLASAGHALLTAHCLATAPGLGLGPGGGDLAEEAGPLTAEADGPGSRSFGAHAAEALSADDALLATTSWGRKFLGLRKAVRGFGSFGVANGFSRIRS